MGGLKFEMQRGGREIPNRAPFHENGARDILQVGKETVKRTSVQDIVAVFNRRRTQLKQWWQKVSGWIAALFRPMTKILWRNGTSGSNKRKTPVSVREPEIGTEMTALGRTGMRLRSGLTNDHGPSDSQGAGGSQAEPSTARRPSVDPDRVIAGRQENLEQEDATQLLQNQTIILYLNAAQIVAAQALGILDEGPRLSKDDIEDTSKASVIAKSFAALQLLWFAARVIIQLCQSHPITQLELATCTYILCALVAYALYWSRPQGVERPIEHSVPLSRTVRKVTDQDIEFLKWFGGSQFLIRNFASPFGMDNQPLDPTKPIPTDISVTAFTFIGPKDKGVALFDDDFAGTIVGIVFGAIYCLGWNHAFPSLWEKWAWQGASVVITGSLIPYSIANGVCTFAFRHLDGKTHIMHCLVLYTLLGVYISCRVFMLVEMVRTLFV